MTTLIVRRPRQDGGDLRYRLTKSVRSAAEADVHLLRARLTRTLAGWVHEEAMETAVLLAGELLANAVRHARDPGGGRPLVTLHARLVRDRLLLEVRDRDPRPPCPRSAEADDESGRGLALVQALADRFGVSHRPDGKTVWFSLAVPPPVAQGKPSATDLDRERNPVVASRLCERCHMADSPACERCHPQIPGL